LRTLVWFWLVGLSMLVGVVMVVPEIIPGSNASAVTAAAVICVGAGLLAIVPPTLVVQRHPDYLIQAGLGAMAVRLLLTLGSGAAYFMVYAPPQNLFMSAMVVGYLAVLAVETGVTVHLVKRYWRPPSMR